MDRDAVRAEIENSVGGLTDDEVTMLADMSLIAWQSLAGPPRGADLDRMTYIARVFGTRSKSPRTVLRKVISSLGERAGYIPGSDVMRAAGLATPRVPR